jgi:hypothetical protein
VPGEGVLIVCEHGDDICTVPPVGSELSRAVGIAKDSECRIVEGEHLFDAGVSI